jgi:hypothetical protein
MKLWKSGFFRYAKKPPFAPIVGGGTPSNDDGKIDYSIPGNPL